MRYENAVETLFQAPHEQFVVERKRLAGELKAAGDKSGAAKLAKLARPPISAWTVDQLWWRARDAFEALFETAERVRRGELGATAAHRDALAQLRAQAIQILGDAQHGAGEATLRRVTQTLSALAAAGDWAPDQPGALTADRDPPGFEAIGISNVIPFPVQQRPVPEAASGGQRHAGEAEAGEATEAGGAAPAERQRSDADEARRRRDREREVAAARAEAAADLRRAEVERARAAAERHRLEAALRTARGDIAQREREVVKLERDLAYARTMVEQARDVVTGLEERLAQLDN